MVTDDSYVMTRDNPPHNANQFELPFMNHTRDPLSLSEMEWNTCARIVDPISIDSKRLRESISRKSSHKLYITRSFFPFLLNFLMQLLQNLRNA